MSFNTDLFIKGDIKQLALDPVELEEVVSNIKKFKLDFDDSYQYSLSLKYDLKIVTLDQDFQKHGIQTLEPIQILNTLDRE